jgi:hypothetical protein
MAQWGPSQQLDIAFKLLASECPTDQIQAVLRDGKKLDRDGVRITAANKEAMLDNLKKAVGRGIPASKVFGLVQESEENGSQHIFYFKPRNAQVAKAHKDASAVSKTLFGKSDLSALGFPHFVLMPDAYEWCDLRLLGKDQWLAKMYGKEEVKVREGEPERVGNRILVGYELKPRRTVLVVKRHADGLIELRVPRIESAEIVTAMRDRLTDAMKGVIDWNDHLPWDLGGARVRLSAEASKNSSIYSLGDIALGDSEGGKWSIHPASEDGDLYAATERQKAVKAVLDEEGSCDVLVVQWKPDTAGRIPKGLRTVIGSNRAEAPVNEIIVTRKTSSAAVSYVTDQLRHFAS